MSMLTEAAIFLAAAVIAVPVFTKLRLGAVLGYLAAGAVIGPSGLALITDAGDILTFSKIGVVLLLFIIGLEMAPTRLWTLRRRIFGLGPLQVVLAAVPIGAGAWWAGLSAPAVVVVAAGLAFSSTAIPVQALEERGELKTAHGRAAFAILLFKYLALLPLLAAMPLLARGVGAMDPATLAWAAGETVAVLAAIAVGGHYALRPLLRVVARADDGDTFTASALLVVLGTAVLVDSTGLPMAIGAFLAGVLLADCEYRHEIHARVDPFKGVLLGLFFLAVGMTADLGLVVRQPELMAGLVAAVLAVKLAGLYAVGRAAGLTREGSVRLAAFLPQAGELAFVVFATAQTHDVLTKPTSDLLIAVTTLTMAATPLAIVVAERWVAPGLRPPEPEPEVDAGPSEVVVIGFGRFGQLVGRLLHRAGIAFTALDANSQQVEFLRRVGHRVSYGNADRAGVLEAAGVGEARAVVLAVNKIDASVRIAASLRRYHPDVPVYAVARTRAHAWWLMDQGAAHVVRSALTASLEMGTAVLRGCGWSELEAADTADAFRAEDERRLREQYAVHSQRGPLSPGEEEVARELEDLFEGERRRGDRPPDA